MRASTKLAPLAVCAAAFSAAGCAAGGQTPASPHVAVSISAPTSGATIGVHKLTVVGTVIPAGARVAVNGQPAKVTGTSFTGTLYVSAANQKIVVSGVAQGYVPSQATTTVSYSHSVAQQLAAAAVSLGRAAASANAAVPAVLLSQAFGLPPTIPGQSSPAVGHTRTMPASSTTSPASAKSKTPASTSTRSRKSGTRSGHSGSTTQPKASPAPVPVATPAQVAAAIRTAWVHGCVHAQAGADVKPYCTCTYNHLAGELQTPTEAQHVLRSLLPYLRTGDFGKLPRSIRRAVNACAGKLPPLDPVTGAPVVSPLPGSSAPAAPSPTSQTTTSGTQTTTGTSTGTQTTTGTVTGTTTGTQVTTGTQAATGPTPLAATSQPVSAGSAFQQLDDALAAHRPPSLAPGEAGSVRQAYGGVAQPWLAPQGGTQGLGSSRVVADALGYAVLWIAHHDRSGPYPDWNRVKRSLYKRLAAALKLTA